MADWDVVSHAPSTPAAPPPGWAAVSHAAVSDEEVNRRQNAAINAKNPETPVAQQGFFDSVHQTLIKPVLDQVQNIFKRGGVAVLSDLADALGDQAAKFAGDPDIRNLPIVGPASVATANRMQAQYDAGNYAGMAGSLLGFLAPFAAPEMLARAPETLAAARSAASTVASKLPDAIPTVPGIVADAAGIVHPALGYAAKTYNRVAKFGNAALDLGADDAAAAPASPPPLAGADLARQQNILAGRAADRAALVNRLRESIAPGEVPAVAASPAEPWAVVSHAPSAAPPAAAPLSAAGFGYDAEAQAYRDLATEQRASPVATPVATPPALSPEPAAPVDPVRAAQQRIDRADRFAAYTLKQAYRDLAREQRASPVATPVATPPAAAPDSPAPESPAAPVDPVRAAQQRIEDAADEQATRMQAQAEDIIWANRAHRADRFAAYMLRQGVEPTPVNLARAAKEMGEKGGAPSEETLDMIHDRMGYSADAAETATRARLAETLAPAEAAALKPGIATIADEPETAQQLRASVEAETLTPDADAAPAADAPTDLERQLQDSIDAANARKAAQTTPTETPEAAQVARDECLIAGPAATGFSCLAAENYNRGDRPNARASKPAVASWTTPGGVVKDLLPDESHDSAIVRLTGKTRQTSTPFDQGWVRQRGDSVQLNDLRNPSLPAAFNRALKATTPGSPIYVNHLGGAIEVPAVAANDFLANAAAGKYSKPSRAAMPSANAVDAAEAATRARMLAEFRGR